MAGGGGIRRYRPGQGGWLGVLWLAFACLFAAPSARAAGKIPVDVELILAVDVSHSMTARELAIQRRGYAQALASPEVARAVERGVLGRIALTYIEWGSVGWRHVVLDWTLVEGAADLARVAARLGRPSKVQRLRTSISSLLDDTSLRFDGNGFAGTRRIIDVSGDGPNNQGRFVALARDDAVARGITINGLPLLTREGVDTHFHLADLDDYYRHCVTGGPASFVLPVHAWHEFAEAVRRKLVLEIAHPPSLRLWRAADARGARPGGYDCLIGEKLWLEYLQKRRVNGTEE